MEQKRAQTLEALEAFIHSQRALLARTQSDIVRLHRLRGDVTARPAHIISNLTEEIRETTSQLANPCDAQLALPSNIDWTVYDAHDPKALQTITFDVRQKHEQRNKPCPHQRSDLSDLQKLVKDARLTIVDPVLALFECVSEPEPDDEPQQKLDPEEARREREREKLRELKKRKIKSYGGLGLPSTYGRGLAGVFIRHDVEDESVEVDVTLDASRQEGDAMDVDTPAFTPSSSTSIAQQQPTSPTMPRSRLPSHKLQSQNGSKAKAVSKIKTASAASSKRKVKDPTPADDESASVPAPNTKSGRGSDKPKPETYKQAWSESEQNMLEQLLEQIPEGEKNRWQKISRAMNGRRTPRQVASRVQKYFEKLKRFGIGDG
ncbi:hypothetical protein FPV67DRAFT_1478044 [Lyophyllum atratum]|nr:hypothetical protein FPV67DRAFT_1478044 [Lyophyllum atratum]